MMLLTTKAKQEEMGCKIRQYVVMMSPSSTMHCREKTKLAPSYLKNSMSSAVFKVGIIGIINTNTLDGRCVKTIVFTIPNFVAMGLQ